MPEQLFYNGHGFGLDCVWFRIVRQPIIGGTGRTNYVDHRWYLNGRVNGANTAAVVAGVQAVENALVPGGDLVFTIYHKLLNADCVAGTQIRNFVWSEGYDGVRGSGAELVLRRTFSCIISGRTIATSDTDLVQYSETIRGVGTGGPITYPVTSLIGAVQAQQTVLFTPYWTTQSGFAVGLTAEPPASTPIWQFTPNVFYMPDQVSIGLSTPINWGINVNTGFRTEWRYVCWSAFPIVVNPISPF